MEIFKCSICNYTRIKAGVKDKVEIVPSDSKEGIDCFEIDGKRYKVKLPSDKEVIDRICKSCINQGTKMFLDFKEIGIQLWDISEEISRNLNDRIIYGKYESPNCRISCLGETPYFLHGFKVFYIPEEDDNKKKVEVVLRNKYYRPVKDGFVTIHKNWIRYFKKDPDSLKEAIYESLIELKK